MSATTEPSRRPAKYPAAPAPAQSKDASGDHTAPNSPSPNEADGKAASEAAARAWAEKRPHSAAAEAKRPWTHRQERGERGGIGVNLSEVIAGTV